MSRDTGIQGESALLKLPSIVPYTSFPIDIMHLFYNVQKLLLSLHLETPHESYSIDPVTADCLSDEFVRFASGISGQMYPQPRPLVNYSTWKAAEF